MSDPIKHLRELLAKATPGTWHENRGRIVGGPDDQPNDAEVVAACYGLSATRNGNAALIVAAVNALPALLDMAEAVKEVRGIRVQRVKDESSWGAADKTYSVTQLMNAEMRMYQALLKLEASHG